MLKTLTLQNFTAFGDAKLSFGRHLNVIVGENGAGKTHLLKVAYSVLAASAEERRRSTQSLPTKAILQQRIADKLVNVFRPDALGRLAKRRQGRERSDVRLGFASKPLDLSFSFSTNSKTEVAVDLLPTKWVDVSPVYMPTRELLTIYPNFASVYESHLLEFEETWRDTCLLLGSPLRKGKTEAKIRKLIDPLEEAMQGSIVLDRTGRFYLRSAAGLLEMPLVAEGVRKFGMLARLIHSGALLDRGYLFWDEPEANLNPRLIKKIASSIIEVSKAGVQTFIATHSLYLLREIEMLTSSGSAPMEVRYFGLHQGPDEVEVSQGPTPSDLGEIAALEEELSQSDRYLESVE